MMIPGALEPRRHATAPVAPTPPPASTHASTGAADNPAPPQIRPAERSGWILLAIFAATLLAVTWIAMFFQRVT
jgi:hypothetical protein